MKKCTKKMVLIKKSFVHYRVSWISVMRGILFSLKNYYFFEVIITRLISSIFKFQSHDINFV